jgi:hypothetical protein
MRVFDGAISHAFTDSKTQNVLVSCKISKKLLNIIWRKNELVQNTRLSVHWHVKKSKWQQNDSKRNSFFIPFLVVCDFPPRMGNTMINFYLLYYTISDYWVLIKTDLVFLCRSNACSCAGLDWQFSQYGPCVILFPLLRLETVCTILLSVFDESISVDKRLTKLYSEKSLKGWSKDIVLLLTHPHEESGIIWVYF